MYPKAIDLKGYAVILGGYATVLGVCGALELHLKTYKTRACEAVLVTKLPNVIRGCQCRVLKANRGS